MTTKINTKLKVLIAHQGCVPIYRKGLYERLAAIPDIEYVVLHGKPPHYSDLTPAPEPYDFPNIRIENAEFSLLGKNFVYQPIVRRVLAGDFAGFVLGDELKFISTAIIIFLAKLRGWPVILWGFGYRPDYAVRRSRSILHRFLEIVGRISRSGVYRLVDGYLAYSEVGAALIADNYLPCDRIAVLNNTVDMETQRRLRREIASEAIADAYGSFGYDGTFPVLVYFGRIQDWKRIDLVIDYVCRAKNRGQRIGLLIFGSGADKDRLVKYAADLETVRFLAHDDYVLTRALRIASAVVIPGAIGLAITHAFAHGLPIITRLGQRHGPEIDYLKHGENGLLLPEDEQKFHEGLDSFMQDTALQKRLRSGAEAASKQLSVKSMAMAFDGLVRRRLNAHRKM